LRDGIGARAGADGGLAVQIDQTSPDRLIQAQLRAIGILRLDHGPARTGGAQHAPGKAM
jgi:hypothetical protein